MGLLLGNSFEWVAANFAIQHLGGTMVALNSWYTAGELSYVIEHSDISLLVMHDHILKTDYIEMMSGLQPLAERFPLLREIIVIGSRSLEGTVSWDTFIARAGQVAEAEVLANSETVDPDSVAYQLYTSGSTARPKGVMLTHRHLIDNTWEIGVRMHFGPQDVIYMPLSLFWGMGCMNMLIGPLAHRSHIVLQEHFDATEGLEIVDRYGATLLAGTPNIIHAIFQHPRATEYDLSTLKKGTALATPEASRQIIKAVMPYGVHCYGLTETHGFATVNDGNDPIDRRCTTEGRPMPGWEIRIVDPETEMVLGPGEMGEIRLRGRMMAGYYKNPEATAAAYDAEGWFKTGDLGVVDEEGYLSFRGRFKEMLKTGGINVAPVEVEEVIMTHPDVEEAFVTGLPDEVQGEIVAAAVIAKAGRAPTPDDIKTYCATRLAKFKQPRVIRMIRHEDLPLTTTRKVHRMQLRTLFPASVSTKADAISHSA
ncbi:AMP-binding protein [Mesorhizobium sp. L-8-10]|nr:AMP-binding protein [Mesorhizobium sp. L-8-10]